MRASSWVVLSQHHDLDFEHYYYILLYYHYRYTDTLSFSMHQIIITLVYTMITMFYGGARVAWHIKMPSFMKFHTKNYGVLLHKVTLSMLNSPIFDILMKILEIFFVWRNFLEDFILLAFRGKITNLNSFETTSNEFKT